MKKTFILISVLTGLLALCASVGISSDASVEKGEKLFNDPSLSGSGNEKSCGTCHPKGRGMGSAGTKDNLTAMINMCITRPLKGKELDPESTEMESLRLYIKSIGK